MKNVSNNFSTIISMKLLVTGHFWFLGTTPFAVIFLNFKLFKSVDQHLFQSWTRVKSSWQHEIDDKYISEWEIFHQVPPKPLCAVLAGSRILSGFFWEGVLLPHLHIKDLNSKLETKELKHKIFKSYYWFKIFNNVSLFLN